MFLNAPCYLDCLCVDCENNDLISEIDKLCYSYLNLYSISSLLYHLQLSQIKLYACPKYILQSHRTVFLYKSQLTFRKRRMPGFYAYALFKQYCKSGP